MNPKYSHEKAYESNKVYNSTVCTVAMYKVDPIIIKSSVFPSAFILVFWNAPTTAKYRTRL